VLAAQAAVAEALLALGRAAEAAPLLEGASSLEGSAKVRLPDVRARLAWDLARALDALGQSRGRALALAVEAHTLYLQIHRPLDDVLAIDSWLAKRARPSRLRRAVAMRVQAVPRPTSPVSWLAADPGPGTKRPAREAQAR
jgi:hypothetical protein